MWLEDIPLGIVSVLGSYTFTEESIVAFAREYDPQSFHIDKDAAARSPYGGLIASGWQTAAVWMKLMVAYTHAQSGATQANYVSPGVKDLRWPKPVRPGVTLTYTTEAFAKLDWPSRSGFGLLQSRNEARDSGDKLYYSFTSQVLVARRPLLA